LVPKPSGNDFEESLSQTRTLTAKSKLSRTVDLRTMVISRPGALASKSSLQGKTIGEQLLDPCLGRRGGWSLRGPPPGQKDFHPTSFPVPGSSSEMIRHAHPVAGTGKLEGCLSAAARGRPRRIIASAQGNSAWPSAPRVDRAGGVVTSMHFVHTVSKQLPAW
jgi:hypothetical protein